MKRESSGEGVSITMSGQTISLENDEALKQYVINFSEKINNNKIFLQGAFDSFPSFREFLEEHYGDALDITSLSQQYSTLEETQEIDEGRTGNEAAQLPQTAIPIFQPPDSHQRSQQPMNQQVQPADGVIIDTNGEILRPNIPPVQNRPVTQATPVVQEDNPTLIQRLAGFFLRIPFVKDFVKKQQKALPPAKTSPGKDIKTSFLDEITGNGEFQKPEYSSVPAHRKGPHEQSRKKSEEDYDFNQ